MEQQTIGEQTDNYNNNNNKERVLALQKNKQLT